MSRVPCLSRQRQFRGVFRLLHPQVTARSHLGGCGWLRIAGGLGGRQQSLAGQAVFVESSQVTSCQENSLFQIQGALLTWIREVGVKLLAERPKRLTEWMDPGQK